MSSINPSQRLYLTFIMERLKGTRIHELPRKTVVINLSLLDTPLQPGRPVCGSRILDPSLGSLPYRVPLLERHNGILLVSS
jgi:hypothetical protein